MSKIKCPHGRSRYKNCPHCLGLNNTTDERTWNGSEIIDTAIKRGILKVQNMLCAKCGTKDFKTLCPKGEHIPVVEEELR